MVKMDVEVSLARHYNKVTLRVEEEIAATPGTTEFSLRVREVFNVLHSECDHQLDKIDALNEVKN